MTIQCVVVVFMCVIATRVHATDAPRALDQPHAYLRARERERKQSRVRDNAQLWRNEGDAKYSNQNKILFINKMLTADMFVLFVSLIVCAAAIVYMFHHRPPHMFACLCVCANRAVPAESSTAQNRMIQRDCHWQSHCARDNQNKSAELSILSAVCAREKHKPSKL